MTEFDYSNMTPENVRAAASTAAEAIRYLNHATLFRERGALKYPADVDAVIRDLGVVAQRMPQLLDQLGLRLEAEAEAGHLEVTYGKFAGKPELAVDVARMSLEAVAGRFRESERSLNAAHQITAAIASTTISEENE